MKQILDKQTLKKTIIYVLLDFIYEFKKTLLLKLIEIKNNLKIIKTSF